jgi:DNA-directed RNA polymerase specialized sigma24 family protein
MTEEEFDDELRRSAFAVAYRMLGSVSEAEDVVQEGLLRLHWARGRRSRPSQLGILRHLCNLGHYRQTRKVENGTSPQRSWRAFRVRGFAQ